MLVGSAVIDAVSGLVSEATVVTVRDAVTKVEEDISDRCPEDSIEDNEFEVEGPAKEEPEGPVVVEESVTPEDGPFDVAEEPPPDVVEGAVPVGVVNEVMRP